MPSNSNVFLPGAEITSFNSSSSTFSAPTNVNTSSNQNTNQIKSFLNPGSSEKTSDFVDPFASSNSDLSQTSGLFGNPSHGFSFGTPTPAPFGAPTGLFGAPAPALFGGAPSGHYGAPIGPFRGQAAFGLFGPQGPVAKIAEVQVLCIYSSSYFQIELKASLLKKVENISNWCGFWIVKHNGLTHSALLLSFDPFGFDIGSSCNNSTRRLKALNLIMNNQFTMSWKEDVSALLSIRTNENLVFNFESLP